MHRRREVLVDALPDRASADMAPARHKLGLALGQLSKPHREAVELLKIEGLSTDLLEFAMRSQSPRARGRSPVV